MQRQLLNSPTDGNGTISSNITTRNMPMNTMAVRQSLSGPDVIANNINPGMQRNMQQSTQRNTAQRDCGCGNKNNSRVNPPPIANRQQQVQAKQMIPPPRAAVLQNTSPAKNYYNKTAAKYPQQNQ